MYLHLGKDTVVRTSEVLAVLDLDNASHSILTREFLSRAEKGGRVQNVSDELPKSSVVCVSPGGKETIYLSQLSSATLLRRVGAENFEL